MVEMLRYGNLGKLQIESDSVIIDLLNRIGIPDRGDLIVTFTGSIGESDPISLDTELA